MWEQSQCTKWLFPNCALTQPKEGSLNSRQHNALCTAVASKREKAAKSPVEPRGCLFAPVHLRVSNTVYFLVQIINPSVGSCGTCFCQLLPDNLSKYNPGWWNTGSQQNQNCELTRRCGLDPTRWKPVEFCMPTDPQGRVEVVCDSTPEAQRGFAMVIPPQALQ